MIAWLCIAVAAVCVACAIAIGDHSTARINVDDTAVSASASGVGK